MKYVLEFAPPAQGLEGNFNTFRLGRAWSKKLNKGDVALLIKKPELFVLAEARVTKVLVGRLREMATLYAHENHNQRLGDREGAAERLIESMKRRYGPHMVDDNRFVTVIYLRV